MNGRSVLAPVSSWSRTQYVPGSALSVMEKASLPFSLLAVAETPFPLTHTDTGHLSNAPATATVTVVPRCPPAGTRCVTVGAAKEELTTETQRHRENQKLVFCLLCVSVSLWLIFLPH